MVIKPASSHGFLHYSNQETTDTGACKQIGFNLHLPLCISISCRSWQDCADTLTTISVPTFVDNNWSTVGSWSYELQNCVVYSACFVYCPRFYLKSRNPSCHIHHASCKENSACWVIASRFLCGQVTTWVWLT